VKEIMSEVRYSEGNLVTFEDCTAYSNISAGEMVCLGTAAAAGGGTNIFTLGHAVAGLSASALLGYHFIGVLDEDISAGQSPVTVHTNGIFKMVTSSGNLTANMVIGYPAYAGSGNIVTIGVGHATGDVPIGSLVGLCGSGTLATGAYVDIMIRPGAYRWTIWQQAITAATSATSPDALCYPKQGA